MKKLILLLFIPLVFSCGMSNEETEKFIKNEIIKAVEKNYNFDYLDLQLEKNDDEFSGFGFLNISNGDLEEIYYVDFYIKNDSLWLGIHGDNRRWEILKSIQNDGGQSVFSEDVVDSLGIEKVRVEDNYQSFN